MSKDDKTPEQGTIGEMEALVHDTYRGLLDLLPSWISSRMSTPKGIGHFSKQFVSVLQTYIEAKIKEKEEPIDFGDGKRCDPGCARFFDPSDLCDCKDDY